MQKNYYTIKEVSAITEISPHTLRYWEEKFRLLKPLRLSSNHRRYTKKDLETINKIKELVFVKGFSLAGARKILNSKKNLEEKKDTKNFITEKEKSEILNIFSEIKKELSEIVSDIEKIEK